MVALMVVMLDEGADLGLEVSGQEVVFQQDAVLEGLVPALDLALGLGTHRSAPNMAHALGLVDSRPVRQRCSSGRSTSEAARQRPRTGALLHA